MLKATLTRSLVATTLLFAATAQAKHNRRPVDHAVQGSKRSVSVPRKGVHKASFVVSTARREEAKRRSTTAVVVSRRVSPAPQRVRRVTYVRPAAVSYRRPTAIVAYNRVPARRVTRSRIYLTAPAAGSRRALSAHERAFRRLDGNGDGYVSRLEARRAGRSWRAFRRADRNRDGRLTRYEARAL